MNIVFDQGTPVPLRNFLIGHTIATAYELCWGTLNNGVLISTAESAGYHLLITTDKNLKYQQNLANRKIAILVLDTTSWPQLRLHAAEIAKFVNTITLGDFVEYQTKRN
jgi:hypothetical protein